MEAPAQTGVGHLGTPIVGAQAMKELMAAGHEGAPLRCGSRRGQRPTSALDYWARGVGRTCNCRGGGRPHTGLDVGRARDH